MTKVFLKFPCGSLTNILVFQWITRFANLEPTCLASYQTYDPFRTLIALLFSILLEPLQPVVPSIIVVIMGIDLPFGERMVVAADQRFLR